MIEISEVMYGWLTLRIKDHAFTVSYLVDFRAEIERLLYLKDNNTDINRICLDGEGFILYLTAWRDPYNSDTLYILWEELTLDTPVKDIINLSYQETVAYFKEWFEDNKELYEKHFALEGCFGEKYKPLNKFDFFRRDLKELYNKYNLCLTIKDDIDYDYEENPYVADSYIIIEDCNDKYYCENLEKEE